MRAEAASTSHSLPLPPPFILSPTRPDAPSLGIPPPLSISVPTSSPPLLLPSASHREDRPEVTLPPRKRLAGGLRVDYGFVATMDREIRRDPEREVGYGITDSWDEIVETLQGAPVSTDTDEIYTRLDDEQKLDYPESLERSMDCSDLACGEVMSLRTTVLGQMSEIRELHAADRRRQDVTSEMLKVDHRRSEKMRELRTADRTRQQQLIQTLTVKQSLQREVTPLLGQGVTTALVARDANRNGDDSYTSRTGGRRTERIVRECTYQDFIKCKPLYFKGTEGVVELIQWFERIETVFLISKCSDVAYAMTWADLRKKMTDKYCLRNEMKKLEAELWNLKVKGTDVIGYNQRFQELALLCVRMFREESDKIERYVGGLPDMIHGNIVASKPKTMQVAVEMITELMDKKVSTIAERQAEGAGNANNQRGTGSGQKPTCFKCGVQGHFKRECPKLKNNKNRGNQVGNDRAPAKVYVVGRAGTNPDSNIVTGTFLLNNRYASILFDTGADRSFVSTTFSSQMDITPSTLDHYYDVELADGRIIGLNTILRGCTLNLLNHPFNINLMPVELGSFDAIIGMDWLAKYQAIIVCAEKIVRIPWGNETLIVHGDGSNRGHEARLHIISYSKTQEYMLKGCPVFLAHVTTNEVEDKS
ncbi:putative reverse transcriptase domain-containing protein [Tanacetum coccineum]